MCKTRFTFCFILVSFWHLITFLNVLYYKKIVSINVTQNSISMKFSLFCFFCYVKFKTESIDSIQKVYIDRWWEFPITFYWYVLFSRVFHFLNILNFSLQRFCIYALGYGGRRGKASRRYSEKCILLCLQDIFWNFFDKMMISPKETFLRHCLPQLI